ncbi:hypothetical protein TB1_022224 [Malus domestica]|uniref:Uncharacterized protein n=1 Tax=Malus domestica TaxID=3750 RepID=A0A498HKU3_MALDO|nr:hypothetical protein DVH24_015546 [Malus domestica]
MGINPTVYELDEDPRGKDLERALMRLLGTSSTVSTSGMKRRLTVGWLTKPPWFILLVTMAYIAKLCPPILEFRINLDRIIRICRRPGLPMVVCCSSRDELDAISSAVANVPYISLASLDYASLFNGDGHGT